VADPKPVAVVLAGGSGTRFWPLSQQKLPKQFLPLISERSLLQATVDRLSGLIDDDRIAICSAEEQEPLLHEQLPHIRHRILEPHGRNTAAALMLSLSWLLKHGHGPETPMLALPADHFIGEVPAFHVALRTALQAASSGALVTLGIRPSFPHTGYGYIEAGDALEARLLRRDRLVAVAAVDRERQRPRARRGQRSGQPGQLPQQGSRWSTISRTLKSAAARQLSAAP